MRLHRRDSASPTTPFYGSMRRMRDAVDDGARAHGQPQAGPAPDASRLDLRALYPRRRTQRGQARARRDGQDLPHTSLSGPVHRACEPGRWASDISYIPMAKGFMYLVAIMDWYSRRVLSWRVSN